MEENDLQQVVYCYSSVDVVLKLPSINANRKNVMDESDVIAVNILEAIQMGCGYFATASDMWLSKFRKSFMELTLYYLDDTFNMKNFTLEVKEVFGIHIDDIIKE